MFHSPGYHPIEDLCAAGDFVRFERYFLFQSRQGLAEAVAGNAAANRVKLPHQREDIVAHTRKIECGSSNAEKSLAWVGIIIR
jgi:hypothetical protein